MTKKKHVVVGLSGGVDSSLSAALLLEQGFHVTGVHLQTVHDIPGEFGCTSSMDRQDAIRAAAHLDIQIEIIDAASVYKKNVLEPFYDSYEKNLTPNPDVWCNERVKFPLLLEVAEKLGADLIATGHYARTNEQGELFRGMDPKKDQSYFLCRLSSDVLKRTLFPLGEIKKTDVRKRAQKLGLPVAHKKDSVGLCFVGDVDMGLFLAGRISESPGPIVTTTNKPIGEHRGLPFYTIGQRRGIELGGGPWYVVKKNVNSNTLIVSNVQGEPELYSKELFLRDMWWVAGEASELSTQCNVQIRYRQDAPIARISSEANGSARVQFESAQRAITPGQHAVIYQADQLLGSGVIQEFAT